MTDNEIIKALECCKTSDSDSCKKCPLYNGNKPCKENLDEHIFDLINRQKAEIERLNVELVGMRGACESYKIHYDNAQAEIERLEGILGKRCDVCPAVTTARKELAEKLYEKIEQNAKFGFAYVTKKEIENVVRELEGEENV